MDLGSHISAVEEITGPFYNYMKFKKGFEMSSTVR